MGGFIWCLNKNLSGLADPFAIVDTTKCPRLHCRMRELAAVFPCECLGEWLIRETFKKAVGCSSYMYSDAKVLIFLDIPILFAIYLTDSYQFQGLKGSTSLLFYANSLFNPPPYTIPFSLTGERDVSFCRYGVRCFISVI